MFQRRISNPPPPANDSQLSSEDVSDAEKPYPEMFYMTDEGLKIPFSSFLFRVGERLSLSFNAPRWKDTLIPIVDLAVKQYNLDNGTSFEFVRFLQVERAIVTGFMYYMIFDAKQPETPLASTFYAKIWRGIPDLTVEYCGKISPSDPKFFHVPDVSTGHWKVSDQGQWNSPWIAPRRWIPPISGKGESKESGQGSSTPGKMA